MAIIGLTDKRERSDRSILGRVEIKVFKGERSSGQRNTSSFRAGKSLDSYYRISTENPRIRKILSSVYGEPNKDGDILTDQINIYLPFNEPDRTFATAMRAFGTSGVEVECDRNSISGEVEEFKDPKGNVFRPFHSCNKPCPVADQPLGVDCPRGCKPQGVFYFYIRELFDADLIIPAQITMKGYSDITYLTDRLPEIANELGNLTNSPFPCFRTRHKIPYVLTRTKIAIKRPVMDTSEENGRKTYTRSGKKTDGSTWSVELHPDAEYMELFRAWKLADELKRMSVALPPRVVTGLLKGDASAIEFIDVDAIAVPEQKQLAAAVDDGDQPITQQEWKVANELLKENNWSKDAIACLLQDRFGVSRAGDLTKKALRKIEAIACDDDERVFWEAESQEF